MKGALFAAMAKYKIEYYRDKNGKSEILDFIKGLLECLETNKNARIQFRQIAKHLDLLSEHGTNLPEKYTKHIDENIWELRPGANRIFYFCLCGDTFIMLHHFRKKTNKTPKNEILRAKTERDDYLRRNK